MKSRESAESSGAWGEQKSTIFHREERWVRFASIGSKLPVPTLLSKHGRHGHFSPYPRDFPSTVCYPCPVLSGFRHNSSKSQVCDLRVSYETTIGKSRVRIASESGSPKLGIVLSGELSCLVRGMNGGGATCESHLWSGRRDSNPRQPAWKAGTLPAELLPQT